MDLKVTLLRQKKLRGIISQGLALPLNPNYGLKNLPIGTEITNLLGILKYDPPMPACLTGVAKGKFPSFIPKTDEIRIQSAIGVLERHKGKKFYIAEKIDGCLEGFTNIITPYGSRTIQELCEICYSGLVLSRDLYTGKNIFDTVINTSINNSDLCELDKFVADKIKE